MEYFIIGWAACGVASYGLCVNYFQTKYSMIAKDTLNSDRFYAFLTGLAGPAALVVALVHCFVENRWGWKL